MNEDEWRKNNWRCNHGWLRGEQCEICNAPKRQWVDLTDDELLHIGVATGLERAAVEMISNKLKEKNNG
jgi:hypothetical protein